MTRLRRLLRALVAILALVAAVLALGTLIPRPLFPEPRQAEHRPHRILVITNPIHTDIAMPLDDGLQDKLGFVARDGVPIDAPGARYVLVGWGGRDFYLQTPTWSKLKLVPLLKGITLDRSVLHVEATADLAQGAPNVSVFDLSDAEFDALTDFIVGSFATSKSSPVAIPGAHYGEYDAFYEAKGYFTALAGCNIWAAAALRSAGLRTGWWNPLPILLTISLRTYN